MVVCSFVGHKGVYDTDLASRVQTEVDRLVKEYEAVEFWVYPAGMFSYMFLLAVLRVKTRYPQKVTISLVSYHNSANKMNDQELVYSYISDKVITLNMADTRKEDPTIGYKRMVKWIVQNSTHLISYLYDMIYDPDNQLVEVPERLEIISLTTPETEADILEAVPRMTEKEQIVFRKLHEGCTRKEAGAAVGVGKERTRQLIYNGCKTIRSALKQKYNQAMASKKLEPLTCGLFALGEATYESLTCFDRIMKFLTSVYIATDIYVEQSYVPSGFLFVLENLSISFMPHLRTDIAIHITALMEDASLPEGCKDMDAVKVPLCSPCHAVGYVSRVDSVDGVDDFCVIADMIERTDFCICNLSATPYGEKIKEYASQIGRTVLLDIGKQRNS